MGVVELEAAAALYSSALLEELGPFALVDRLVELWMRGGLPMGPASRVSRRLDGYWLGRDARLTDDERRAVFARVFDPLFEERWAALLVALAQPAGDDAGARAAAVRAHLNARVDETSLRVAREIVPQLREVLDILSEPEILQAYGASDLWQLAQQLARLELGTEPDVDRVRTQAAAGTVVVAWLAGDDAVAPEDVADAAQSWLAAAGPPADGDDG